MCITDIKYTSDSGRCPTQYASSSVEIPRVILHNLYLWPPYVVNV